MTEHSAFAMGWISGLCMGMGLMKLAWERERRYQRRRAGPGHEPLPPAPITVEEWARRRSNRDDDRLDALQRAPIKPQFPSPRKIREDFLP